AVDEADLFLGEQLAEPACRLDEGRVRTGSGAAINADRSNRAHARRSATPVRSASRQETARETAREAGPEPPRRSARKATKEPAACRAFRRRAGCSQLSGKGLSDRNIRNGIRIFSAIGNDHWYIEGEIERS